MRKFLNNVLLICLAAAIIGITLALAGIDDPYISYLIAGILIIAASRLLGWPGGLV